MISDSIDNTVVKNDYFICILNGGYTLCNDNFGSMGNFFKESLSDKGIGFGIDSTCGVVKNENFRFFKQSSCNTKTLTLTA